MNWRNPFIVTYLAVTAVGAGILGYLVYSSYTHSAEIAASYDETVLKLRKLQNKVPFPSAENNQKYVEYTKEYRAQYDQLVAKVSSMQKPLEDITPQAFGDRLRENVSQVEAAAKANGVTLAPEFYLGFDQYRGTLPADAAAAPLARELAAIRLIVDNLIQLKVKEISGIKRDLLPEEGGAAAAAQPTPPGRTPPGRSGAPAQDAPKILTASPFDIVFVANQSAVRSALNFIDSADQFFVIRSLNIENSADSGPKRVEEATAAAATPEPAPGAEVSAEPKSSMRVLVGRESLKVGLRVEMINFNTPSKK